MNNNNNLTINKNLISPIKKFLNKFDFTEILIFNSIEIVKSFWYLIVYEWFLLDNIIYRKIKTGDLKRKKKSSTQ